jgi:hypothetical protein
MIEFFKRVPGTNVLAGTHGTIKRSRHQKVARSRGGGFRILFYPEYTYKQSTNPDGYFIVCANREKIIIPKTVHRLVALAWHKKPPWATQVNHIDGNKTNNHFTNLEWCTCKENIQHASKLGLRPHGEGHAWAKLNEAQVREIKKLLGKVSRSTIAERYGVSKGAIQCIANGKSWKHITGE